MSVGISVGPDGVGIGRWSFGRGDVRISGSGNPFSRPPLTRAQEYAQAELRSTNILRGVGIPLMEAMESAMHAAPGSPAQKQAIASYVEQLNSITDGQGRMGLDARLHGTSKVTSLEAGGKSVNVPANGSITLAALTGELLAGNPQLAKAFDEEFNGQLSAKYAKINAALQNTGPVLPQGTADEALAPSLAVTLETIIKRETAALEGSKADKPTHDAIAQRFVKSLQEAVKGKDKDGLITVKGPVSIGDLNIPEGSSRDFAPASLVVAVAGNAPQEVKNLIGKAFGVAPAPAQQPAVAPKTDVPAQPAPAPGAAQESPALADSFPKSSADTKTRVYAGKADAQGKRATVPENEVPKHMSPEQQKLIQDKLQGITKDGGKYGPETHAAFKKVCERAGVNIGDLDFSKPNDPKLIKVMGELDKGLVKTVKAPQAAPAGQAPASAQAAAVPPTVAAALAVAVGDAVATKAEESLQRIEEALDAGRVKDLVQLAVNMIQSPDREKAMASFEVIVNTMGKNGVQFPKGPISVDTIDGREVKLNFNGEHAKDAAAVLKIIGDTMQKAGIGAKKQMGLEESVPASQMQAALQPIPAGVGVPIGQHPQLQGEDRGFVATRVEPNTLFAGLTFGGGAATRTGADDLTQRLDAALQAPATARSVEMEIGGPGRIPDVRTAEQRAERAGQALA